MTPQRFAQVQELMLAARELPTDEQESFLVERSQGDSALLEEVRSLLAADVEPGETLVSPALGDGFSLDAIVADVAQEPEPTQIGRYHILGTLGEGGMGVVYKAEQRHPIQRTVAVKVIKLGFDSKEVIARFATERQTLAQMDHPNIARVIDAGQTERGRLYFVMEYVPGVPITQFCDSSRLSLRQRLELFIQVCDAISHAHAKATIHRDLKASNVLAHVRNHVSTAKVIDFGIAKALTCDADTRLTQNTHGGQVLGTFESMSPEQAAGLPDIDTRTDVYSLGLLLYRLLAGVAPVDHEKLMKTGTEEIRRKIREEDSVEPSTRLSKLEGESVTLIASARQTSPAALIRTLRGDLDWIVMRCLERDREHRYPTVNALAMDIQRHLNHEPVVARPRTAAYRFRKLVERNPLASVLTAALAAVLVLASVISIGQAIRATRAERQAVESGAISERRAEELRHYLYVSQMNEAGEAMRFLGGVSRTRALLTPWGKSKPDLRGWEWYFLDGESHIELLTLRGHHGPVQSVTWSPDGRRLASCGVDGRLEEWDAATGRELLSLPGRNVAFDAVAWCPDGTRIATAGRDGQITILDSNSGAEVLRISAHSPATSTIAWSPDGERIVSGGTDAAAIIWNAWTGERIRTFSGHARPLSAVAWSRDGHHIASSCIAGGSATAQTKIWDAETGSEVVSIDEDASCLEWSPDGKSLGRGGINWDVRAYSAVDGARVFSQSHGGHVLSVAWNPDGTQLASAGRSDWTIKVWNIRENNLAFALQGHQGQINSIAWSPAGPTIASASDDGTIKIWHAPAANEQHTQPRVLTGHAMMTTENDSNWVETVAWRPDQSMLASGARDGLVTLSDPNSGQELFALAGHTGWVYTLAWSPDGKFLASGSVDKTVRIWDIATRSEVQVLRGHTNEVRGLAWSRDGTRLASGSADTTIRIWDAKSWSLIREITGHSGGILSIDWSRDGSRLLSASHDHTARIWDIETGQELLAYRGHSNWLEEARFSPDGARVASASLDHTVRIWDAADGHELLVLNGHLDWVKGVVWSPDGTRLASAANDQTVKIWDTTIGQLALTLYSSDPMYDVADVAWSPDGKRLAAAGRRGYLVIYDAQPGYVRALASDPLPTSSRASGVAD